ncbi:MAG: glutamate--tRNA ligase [Candidatus Freyarchaeota archaeon]|nr:glutamate--tRNA ligase [Candidatus Jordarchaeia archaeon]
MEEELRKTLLRHVLANAVKYGGKADAKAVMGKVLSELPELRQRVREVLRAVEEVVEEVNAMPLDAQKRKLEELSPEIPKESKAKEERKLPPLPNVEKYGKVVMRLAPYPSGPLHIGNARMAILNDEYVKRYGGELILVFDDTIGGGEKRVVPEAYDLIVEGLQWLGVEWHREFYKSDRVQIFYDYCEDLIRKMHAYVCTCERREWREKFKEKMKACPHRDSPVEENLERWEGMLEGVYGEGEAVVRLKTGMDLPDPALRDHVIMRISEREHPRVGSKYRVWPLLEFSWAIDDHLLGVTHILRGKDLVKEDAIERFVWRIYGWPEVEFIHYGILTFKGLKLSKTEARRNIERGVYMGWSDPRTWSLQSLQRRGIKPEALRESILSLGLSMIDVEYSPENLYAVNRRIVDPEADRYFFVENPVKLAVDDVPVSRLAARPPFHPDFPERGARTIEVNAKNGRIEVYVDERDAVRMSKGCVFRLKDLLNFEVKGEGEGGVVGVFHSLSVDDARARRAPIIHWVPSEGCLRVKVVKPDGEVVEGLGEPDCRRLAKDKIVQFERYGFCRVDSMEPEIILFFAHN